MRKKIIELFAKTKSFKLPKISLSKKVRKITITVLSVVFVALLAFTFKNKLLSFFFVAKVGNSYITRNDFDKELNKRYSQSVLDNMATLQIVSQELAKNKIVIDDAIVTAKISQIETSLGGSKIDDVLKAQGVSKEEFVSQLKLQLGAEELVKNKITVTDTEIDDFIKTNGSQLVSIVETDKRNEAKNILKEQKVQEQIGTWLSDLKTKYTITQF